LRVRPYGAERWWVLALLAALAVGLVALGTLLSVRRDVGAGLFSARLGRPEATARLAGTWSLAWRLQRGSLIGWTIGMAVGAGVFGAIAQDITAAVGDNPDAAKVLAELGGAGALVDSYLAWVLTVTGLVAGVYAVTAVLRLRSEETDLRAEPVLAAAVSRWKWMASHLVVALAGTVVLLLTAGLVIGLIHGVRSGNMNTVLPKILAGALVQVPAALVLAAVAAALFGIVPRLTVAAWLFVGVALVVSQLGAVLRLGQGVLDVSPFTHLPKLPGGRFTATPLIWLGAMAVVLAAAGLFRFRGRDVGRT
jgi:ABC-2 type transport system permease protein